jgi:hypothetical protein
MINIVFRVAFRAAANSAGRKGRGQGSAGRPTPASRLGRQADPGVKGSWSVCFCDIRGLIAVTNECVRADSTVSGGLLSIGHQLDC